MNRDPAPSLPIRPLGMIERYDCHCCGECCYGTIIPLGREDLARIRQQRWGQQSEYRGKRIILSRGLFKRRYILAKRPDGSCIFLTPQRRCRIHELFGPTAKPLVCQIAPLQLVPLEDFAWLTVRRYCRSAAQERGRPLAEHCEALKDLLQRTGAAPRPSRPPPIVRRHRRTWEDTCRITDALGQLMLEQRYPLVRRLAHGLEFCSLLGQCRLHRLEGQRLGELAGLLKQAAVREAGDLFQRRLPPDRQAGRLFRQTAMEYLRLHPRLALERSWRQRWRLLCAAVAFARGQGPVPVTGLPFAPATFESLERPLGHRDEAVLRPLCAYFEALVASLRFAVPGRPGWSIVESFQALALSYAVGMWVLRLACGQRPVQTSDVAEVVMLLDRAQGYGPAVGRRHRWRVRLLARRRELARLAAWYAR